MNDPDAASGDGAPRRCQTPGEPDESNASTHPASEPHGDIDDPAPEEAGYGYGV